HRRDARGDWREERRHVRQRVFPRDGDPRDGNGAHGRGPQDVRAQQVESGLGRAERVRHRRVVHGVDGVPESFVDVHGAHRARGGSRRGRAHEAQSLTARRPEMSNQSAIDRREAIRRVSALLGGVAFVGGSSLLTAGDQRQAATGPQGGAPAPTSSSTADEVACLDEVAETILPETTTPGAKAARTGAFMALMVNDAYDAKEQQIFRDGMKKLDEASKK